MDKNTFILEDSDFSGSITLENGDLIIELLETKVIKKAPINMTSIIKVTEFDIDIGYLELLTNIGEVYINLECFFRGGGKDYSGIVRTRYMNIIW